MREQHNGENRLEYLVKVLYSFMRNTSAGEYSIIYDGESCDGFCLAEEILNEIGLVYSDIDV